MDLSEKVAAYKRLISQIETLEEEKRNIAAQIIEEMPGSKFETAEFKATRYQRLSIRLSLEKARELQATKMEELVDKEKIKKMFHSGATMEGVEMRSYLLVSAKKGAKCSDGNKEL